jgi:hypothetical protein
MFSWQWRHPCWFSGLYRPADLQINIKLFGAYRLIFTSEDGGNTSLLKHWFVCSYTTHPWRRRGERRYSSYSFTTLALDGGEWSASRPGSVLPPRKDPGTHRTGGCVGPRAGLDTEARGKILCLCRVSNLDSPVIQSIARHYTAWATRFLLNRWYLPKSLQGVTTRRPTPIRADIRNLGRAEQFPSHISDLRGPEYRTEVLNVPSHSRMSL